MTHMMSHDDTYLPAPCASSHVCQLCRHINLPPIPNSSIPHSKIKWEISHWLAFITVTHWEISIWREKKRRRQTFSIFLMTFWVIFKCIEYFSYFHTLIQIFDFAIFCLEKVFSSLLQYTMMCLDIYLSTLDGSEIQTFQSFPSAAWALGACL